MAPSLQRAVTGSQMKSQDYRWRYRRGGPYGKPETPGASDLRQQLHDFNQRQQRKSKPIGAGELEATMKMAGFLFRRQRRQRRRGERLPGTYCLARIRRRFSAPRTMNQRLAAAAGAEGFASASGAGHGRRDEAGQE